MRRTTERDTSGRAGARSTPALRASCRVGGRSCVTARTSNGGGASVARCAAEAGTAGDAAQQSTAIRAVQGIPGSQGTAASCGEQGEQSPPPTALGASAAKYARISTRLAIRRIIPSDL